MDNDGDLDIYLATLPGKNYLYQNNNDGSFTRVVDDVTVSEAYTSSAAVWGDVDDDGDLDLAVNDLEAGVVNLYRNRGNGNHWLEVSCEGITSNRSGLGARVEVRADINGAAVWQAREISNSNGFRQRSQGRRVHFGLGDADIVDELVIRWPSGRTTALSRVEVNQKLRVREPAAEQDQPAE